MKKVYYQVKLAPKSPLRIGNVAHETTNMDLMLDSRGFPFVPGSSLAGVIRHKVEEIFLNEDTKESIRHLFGFVDIEGKDAGEEQRKDNSDAEKQSVYNKADSVLIVGDAVLPSDTDCENDIVISRWDGICLNEWGNVQLTSESGSQSKSKYDYQIVETSKIFTSIIEWTGDDVQEETELTKCLEPVLQSFIAEDIHVGARTSRGFGEFSVSIRKITFQFPEVLAKWLDFDPYDQGAFEYCLENEFVALAVLEGKRLSLDTTIDVRFRMRGTFSVRVNTAKTMVLEDGTVPNTIPLENMKGNPVIPGTAWAGAFRHHMHDLLRDAGIQENSHEMEHLDELFGTKSKSILDFSLSEIIWGEASDKQSATVVRIAVDRFTAQPRTGALFTSKVYCGGEGTLRIRYQENKLTDQDKELLAACLCDMHLGMMPIGGEASVGRGRMEIVGLSVNGEDCLDRMKASVAVLTGKSCENDMGWLRVSSPLQIDNDKEPAAIL